MTDFVAGDVVQLKSGGPLMTIERVGNFGGFGGGPENGAKCVWFEGKKSCERVFDVVVLEKYEATEGFSV